MNRSQGTILWVGLGVVGLNLIKSWATVKSVVSLTPAEQQARTATESSASSYLDLSNLTGSGSTVSSATPSNSAGQAQQAVAWARTQIGKPYQYGATGPNSYDCSGLTQAAYKSVGVSIPRTTEEQILIGTAVSRANLVIGDLVFPDIGHVQLYSGNGNIVEAAHTGTNVREVPIWGFSAARRVVAANRTVSPLNANGL